MRVKKPMLVTAFPNTHAAMQTEKSAAAFEIPGRLIPLPDSVAAGCGLAFCCEPDLRQSLLVMLQEQEIPYEIMKVVEIYVQQKEASQ